MINNIPCTLIDRKQLKTARAWRCCLELPPTEMLASVLTGMIIPTAHYSVEFVSDKIEITIDPMVITDVRKQRKKFILELDTVYEHQFGVGVHLTELDEVPVSITIRPTGADTIKPVFPVDDDITPPMGDTISKQTIKDLHTNYFKSQQFQEYICARTGAYIKNETDCKKVFKDMMGVTSCTGLGQHDFNAMVADRNRWSGEQRV